MEAQYNQLFGGVAFQGDQKIAGKRFSPFSVSWYLTAMKSSKYSRV